MKSITNLMIIKWNMTNQCWMGYEVKRDNPFTFHHLRKKCHNGKLEINNGAILTRNAHEYLHIIESRDLDMYEYINAILKEINIQGYMPIERQLKAIDSILNQFAREHCGDRARNGNLLIKERYLKKY